MFHQYCMAINVKTKPSNSIMKSKELFAQKYEICYKYFEVIFIVK